MARTTIEICRGCEAERHLIAGVCETCRREIDGGRMTEPQSAPEFEAKKFQPAAVPGCSRNMFGAEPGSLFDFDREAEIRHAKAERKRKRLRDKELAGGTVSPADEFVEEQTESLPGQGRLF